MERRHFIKTTATGTALLTTSGVFAFQKNALDEKVPFGYGYQSSRKIPVAYDVDVVIAGGTTAAVAAAVAAAETGASVFLAAPETYLGEDLCSTWQLWTDYSRVTHTSLGKKIFGNGLPTPMHIKKTLDSALIDNNIPFLFSCYVTDIISDQTGKPAGVVISNRSGRQAVKARVVIDATPRGLVARMLGAGFNEYPAGKQEFKYVVVGNRPKNIPGATVRQLPQPVVFRDKTYQALEYTLQLEMNDNSWKSFCRAEQEARDLTWDSDQVEASDNLFQVPPDCVTGEKRWDRPEPDSELISLRVFQPEGIERLFLLSGIADMDRQAASVLLQPGAFIRLGERIGEAAANMAKILPVPTRHLIKGEPFHEHVPGDVSELLKGLRPSLNLGEIEAESTRLPVLGSYDVVVMGGGAAGAPAGVGAARYGARTLVIEYLHGLGGTGTMGMIGRYFHGYKEGFTAEVDNGTRALGGEGHPRHKARPTEWVFDWKTEYFRREIRKAGGEIWFGVLGVGAYVQNNRVKGIVVATPQGKGIVLAHTVIDSTGSGDIAIAAGAGYEYTDASSVAIQGAGLAFKNPNDWYNNTDWTFIDDTDILDVWRTFIIARDKFAQHYDLAKLVQTRERRRVIGDYTVSVLDIYNGRNYPDTFSIHVSRFDTHGYTEDPFFHLKPPSERVEYTALVPFRSLLPRGLEGITVTGLGASAHRDAMPVIRMLPCLQNQGYSMGIAAAIAAANNQNIRHIDFKSLQKELVRIKNLPERVLNYQDIYPPSVAQIQQAAKTVVNNNEGLEILLWDTDRSIPVIEDSFQKSQNTEHRLVYARILGILGVPTGWDSLRRAIDKYEEWDEGWNFRGMHQFGRSLSYLDSLIIALGRTKNPEGIQSIVRLARKLTPECEFSHFHAVAIAMETIEANEEAEVLYHLLQMSGVTGHSMPDIETHRRLTPVPKEQVSHYGEDSTRNNSLRELILGRALFRVGDHGGLGRQILDNYSNDLRGHYYRHASGVLELYSRHV